MLCIIRSQKKIRRAARAARPHQPYSISVSRPPLLQPLGPPLPISVHMHPSVGYYTGSEPDDVYELVLARRQVSLKLDGL